MNRQNNNKLPVKAFAFARGFDCLGAMLKQSKTQQIYAPILLRDLDPHKHL